MRIPNKIIVLKGLVFIRLMAVMSACLVFPNSLKAQMVSFAPLAGEGGKASISSCVTLDKEGRIATVVELGADVNKATLVAGEKKVALEFIVNDPNSRLAIYRVPADFRQLLKSPVVYGSSRALEPSATVYSPDMDRAEGPRFICRVNRFQGKVLPLAVLRINHPKSPPPPGSGIYDADGKLVALVRQTVYNNDKSSFCLPAEVIIRTLEDHKLNGSVSRCWIGIIMDQLVASPIIESVRPNSPASEAGLIKGDVLLSVGAHKVSEYGEVVDAFYYLVSGVPEKFRVIRGTKIMEFDIVPKASP